MAQAFSLDIGEGPWGWLKDSGKLERREVNKNGEQLEKGSGKGAGSACKGGTGGDTGAAGKNPAKGQAQGAARR